MDKYTLLWTGMLVVAWVTTFICDHISGSTPGIAIVFAWIAAYRVLDIVVSRIYILSEFAGSGPFPTLRARRSLFGSMILLLEVIIAFGLMYDGWTGGTPGMWVHSHLILGFSYISTRVIFTLGPPDEATHWLAKLLIGAELVSGFAVIALTIAGYLGSLRGADRSA